METYNFEDINDLSIEEKLTIMLLQGHHINNKYADMQLYVNRDNVGFSTIGKYWCRIDHFLISYVMENTIKAKSKNGKICEGRRLLELTFYDDLIEYEAFRIKETQEAVAKGWPTDGLNNN